MDIEKVIERIAQQRNKKGFTYENMADELDITPAAYRKIQIISEWLFSLHPDVRFCIVLPNL